MDHLGVDEALGSILKDVSPLETELVNLDAAHRRTLAANVVASRGQPPFAASSMDGYAVRASDITAAGAELRVVGEAAAGHAFCESVGSGEAVRIFTGAPLPTGADAVVIQENVARQDDNIIIDVVPVPGAYVRPVGVDFCAGDTLVAAGRRLGSRDLLLAATAGEDRLTVRRRPRVGILATGDELVPPGRGAPRPDQIFSSVPTGLHALTEAFGGEPLLLGIAGDTRQSLGLALAGAESCDVLVTIGGASVGDHDFVHDALGRAGVDLAFWKIAMRPGKPLMYGRRGAQHVLGLPGNPVSGMICGRVFLVPLMNALLGRTTADTTERLPLAEPLSANGPRRHYMRARYVETQGHRTVAAIPDQDSSLTRLLATADCLIVREVAAPAAEAGAMVDVLPLDF